MRFSYPDASGSQLPPSVFGKRRSLLGWVESGWKFAAEEDGSVGEEVGRVLGF
ncbi:MULTISPECIES: hypothetical protein [Arthrospira]|uniref:hypothetical protein n=1 Tax=Oscillatoriales TaxID=1150 RepID=UPI0001D0E898|nr:hypothetical protein [Arthrospira platensis]MBD2671936.1 hypothetical protein [Arthrospira platensis FACHB-439]MBD2712887.1 hypothetical protein [Arthrospira platensis FACHB-835]MDF2207429.1 hypothetical protein [Arthrospira platensis NCB002]MDT9185539.1 hypothetical protein [Limnospira sp. PMC 289.06]MDT9297743.1 hypothetical protein [Arthrospira platensis PCC 7345]MDT9313185.1 hypothetical protein [Limnospira sp. Paracas R14]QQW28534.1 hypothetical protein AP9108_26825 [Arthrospira sp. 